MAVLWTWNGSSNGNFANQDAAFTRASFFFLQWKGSGMKSALKVLAKIYLVLLGILASFGIFSIAKDKLFDWNEERKFYRDMAEYYKRHSQ